MHFIAGILFYNWLNYCFVFLLLSIYLFIYLFISTLGFLDICWFTVLDTMASFLDLFGSSRPLMHFILFCVLVIQTVILPPVCSSIGILAMKCYNCSLFWNIHIFQFFSREIFLGTANFVVSHLNLSLEYVSQCFLGIRIAHKRSNIILISRLRQYFPF